MLSGILYPPPDGKHMLEMADMHLICNSNSRFCEEFACRLVSMTFVYVLKMLMFTSRSKRAKAGGYDGLKMSCV